MPQEFNKTTPNIRFPQQDSESDFGKTVTNVYVPESEYQYQTPGHTQPPQQQYQPQPQQQTQRGIPGWVWALVGVGGFFFIAIAVVLAIIFLTPNPGFNVVVKNAPENSKVFVDNIPRGVTNIKGETTIYNVKSGPRRISVISECYNDYFENVRAEDGDVKEVTVKTARKPSCGGTTTSTPAPSPGLSEEDVIASRIEKDLKETGRARVKEITFDTDKDTIKPFSALILVKVADILKRHPEWNISIEGHTDNQGSAGHNQPLSERRAKAAKLYLSGLGIATNRLSSAGFGLSKPVESNDTEIGREQNRRVEFVKQ